MGVAVVIVNCSEGGGCPGVTGVPVVIVDCSEEADDLVLNVVVGVS